MGSTRVSSRLVAAISGLALTTGLAACGSTPPEVSVRPSAAIGSFAPVEPSASVAPSPSVAVGTPAPTPSPLPTPAKRLASAGSIVSLANEGSLWLVDAGGARTPLASADGGPFTFPAWSPDGSRIAAIRYGPDANHVLILDATGTAAGAPAEPVVLLEARNIAPFYLSWTPDGEGVTYLANESGGLSFRFAPADGSAPTDGSGPGATVATGSPFYFDWVGDGLVAHVGTGPDALLGEIGLDGTPAGPALGPPGSFRSADATPDGDSLGFIRQNADGTSEAVIADRDGTTEQAIPIGDFGALGFDPAGDTLAVLGPIGPPDAPTGFPLGPLRLLDRESGDVRTLLDGSVIAFWWSPDGDTIAALRIQPVDGSNADPAAQDQEIRFFFLDPATGDVRSEAPVVPGRLFLDQVFPFFDQYAVSHDLWAPDSSSFLLPVADRERLAVLTTFYVNGDDPEVLEGSVGFWSP